MTVAWRSTVESVLESFVATTVQVDFSRRMTTVSGAQVLVSVTLPAAARTLTGRCNAGSEPRFGVRTTSPNSCAPEFVEAILMFNVIVAPGGEGVLFGSTVIFVPGCAVADAL